MPGGIPVIKIMMVVMVVIGGGDCDGDCGVMKSCVVLVLMLVVVFQMHHDTGDGDQTS